MLDVGLIGLGPEWEHRYRPALINLRHRMRVRVIQSAVGTLADQTAAEWRCDAAHGLLAAIDRTDVRAVLIFDPAWYGTVPAEFACLKGKPAFLAGRLGEWVARAHALVPLAAETETPLMPDFGHRYTPATSRLKELIASRLGRPDSIVVHTSASESSGNDGNQATGDRRRQIHAPLLSVPCSLSPAQDEFVDQPRVASDALLRALDWACHLIGTAPAEVRGVSAADAGEEAIVKFAQSKSGGVAPTARIVLHRNSPYQSEWSAEVRCRKGLARITGGTQIDWQNAEESRSESLSGEREGVEVMLDHFSRRVVGGLIPLPTLDDLCRASRLADAVQSSRECGQPVMVE